MPGRSITRALACAGRVCAPIAGRVLGFAAVAAFAFLFAARDGAAPVEAAPVNLNVHVHDDYYHPAGAFIVGSGTSHPVAQAACQKANPDPTCDATIHVGDTITWVAPAPLAANVHTVTECTDNTFSVCGPAVAPLNPIGDSGLRQPPPATSPTGWPYGPIQFNTSGVFYYRCEVHPDVMRGRIVVLPVAVGGVAEIDAPVQAQTAAGPSSDRSAVAIATAAGTAAATGAAVLAVLASAGILYARRRSLR